MTIEPIDPAEVRLTGENSYICLSEVSSDELTTRTSHWRVLYSPAGPGHALFIQSELTDNQVAIYSDNIALARWLSEEIEPQIYGPFGDRSIPVVEADFERNGDVRSFYSERIASADVDIVMTWYDFVTPWVMRAPPGLAGRTHGIYNVHIPARRAQLTINGEVAKGRPWPVERYGYAGSTASIAWSEIWVRPRE